MRRRYVLIRRVRQIAMLLASPVWHARLSCILVRAKRSGHLTSALATSFKYLGDYLSQSMSHRERLSSMAFHYNYLSLNVSTSTRACTPARGLRLWQSVTKEGQTLEIAVREARIAPMEGEAELVFLFDGAWLCALTFTFIDGSAVGAGPKPTLFVGGVQGAYNARAAIRQAASKNNEVAPVTMLLTAARGLADALAIGSIAGTTTASQAANGYVADGRTSSHDYDEFWRKAGGTLSGSGYYVSVVAAEPDMDAAIAGNHRRRTRLRRRHKGEVRRVVEASVLAAIGAHAADATR